MTEMNTFVLKVDETKENMSSADRRHGILP